VTSGNVEVGWEYKIMIDGTGQVELFGRMGMEEVK